MRIAIAVLVSLISMRAQIPQPTDFDGYSRSIPRSAHAPLCERFSGASCQLRVVPESAFENYTGSWRFFASMAVKIVKLAGLALTVACWLWAREGQRSDAWNMAIVWCAPLFAYPIAFSGRRALDAQPVIARAERVNVLVHYAMMIALGVGIFPAFRLVYRWPGATIPIPRELGLALLILTGIATFMTVVNLALRGLGAPFAAKLSSRLATGWMYGWTRNPMLLATLAMLLSVGLWYRSVWFLLWVAVSVSPGWIFFVRIYEERELGIRFASAYRDYRARTPFLWPRKPVGHA